MPVGNKNAIIAGCGMHHVAVQTRDWETSLSFYRDVLGMEVIAEFGSPERKIALWTRATEATSNSSLPRPNHPHLELKARMIR